MSSDINDIARLRERRTASRAISHPQPAASQVSGTPSGVRRLTSEESWIEVASQPSSSSLSSAANDEIITTGLRVTQSMNTRRRRRLHRTLSDEVSTGRDGTTLASSQEEYDESDNEDVGFQRQDGYIPSSNFGILPSATSSDSHSTTTDEEMDSATALGVAEPSTVFTPQPNAFTHPPSRGGEPTINTTGQDSYFTQSHTDSRPSQGAATTPPTSQSAARQSYPRSHQRSHSHTPYNIISPNHSLPIDHDAALRASLSTLLSCAAAARGLPKRENTQSQSNPSGSTSHPTRPVPSNRIDQGSLRLIPESSMDGDSPIAPLRLRQTARSSSGDSAAPIKRKSKSPSHDRKRKKRVGLASSDSEDVKTISPTLMTWVAGIGVVVLFSAISFSAGYALGKDVGRHEGSAAGNVNCGPSEAETVFTRTLKGKSWRWGNASGVRA